MNLEEKKQLVIQLHKEGKTQREIAQVAHMSVRDISRIIRKLEGISEEKSIETQALDLFYQGKKPIEVAVDLNLNAQKIVTLYKDYLKLDGFHKLVSVYQEINDNLSLFLKLYYVIVQNNIKPNEILNLVKNSNELANLKIAIQIKRNELYFINEKIKQYQAQIMMMNSYTGYL
ncbi:MAG: helix-turn-helix domain-containing protein [Nitrososphaeraceae archaeon]